MNWYHRLPIQQKMLVMTLTICGAVLLLAIASLFGFQVLNFRASFQNDSAALAVIIADNSTAVMAFKDDNAAAEVVRSLQAKPTVVSASLVLADETYFAHFGKVEPAQALAQFPPPGENRFSGDYLLLTQPVVWKGDRVGTLYLRMDYQRTLRDLLLFYGKVMIGILVASISLAAFLSHRLGRTITDPVRQLALTTRLVGEKKDYSVRAVVTNQGDELGQLAESFNEMLGRIQTQDVALSRSQQKMEALIHSIDGIVWERTLDPARFTFISRQSEAILGYAPQQWLDRPDFWAEKLHPQDAAKALQASAAMAGQGETYCQEYRMIAADGRTVWIRECGTVLMEQGRAVAIRGIFQDITQHKLNAEQLDKLNRQLIDTSRSAGMADVATGVLHNVGNVLNSVSVSATVVADRLRRSKITKLCRATTMLREHNGRLAEYLTTDPKGKLIPEYLSTVADEMAGEQNELITRMSTVGEHIEHIKEIVAMQQNYAKVSGVYENLPAIELVEDALRINATAFDRHGIELVRDFAQNTPTVCVDRHKVLQILINLLRNAKHAMDERNGDFKRLVVRVDAASPAMVRITITDNGVGIPAEHLTKIFNHGFTTKKNGHGFGLHSGGNAAKEMGGSLTGHSAGPGLGAEFTLELPTAPRHRKVAALNLS